MRTSQQLNKPKFYYRASERQRLTAIIICLAIISFFSFFIIAVHFDIDMGRWLGYCGFKQRTGLPCPTCGMTTATFAFAQGKILQAFYIQPACALICSVMVIAALLAFIIAVFGIYFRFLNRFFTEVKIRHIIIALIIIIASGWAVTLARAIVAAEN